MPDFISNNGATIDSPGIPIKSYLTSKTLVIFMKRIVELKSFFIASKIKVHRSLDVSILFFFCVYQVNNSIHVNSVDVPDSDLMATNGVIHVVKNVLYPAGEFFFSHSC